MDILNEINNLADEKLKKPDTVIQEFRVRVTASSGKLDLETIRHLLDKVVAHNEGYEETDAKGSIKVDWVEPI